MPTEWRLRATPKDHRCKRCSPPCLAIRLATSWQALPAQQFCACHVFSVCSGGEHDRDITAAPVHATRAQEAIGRRRLGLQEEMRKTAAGPCAQQIRVMTMMRTVTTRMAIDMRTTIEMAATELANVVGG